jgi:hypothetical protein
MKTLKETMAKIAALLAFAILFLSIHALAFLIECIGAALIALIAQ